MNETGTLDSSSAGPFLPAFGSGWNSSPGSNRERSGSVTTSLYNAIGRSGFHHSNPSPKGEWWNVYKRWITFASGVGFASGITALIIEWVK